MPKNNEQMVRKNVPVGCLFTVANGKLGKKTYAALGTNGKYASFNIRSKKLSFAPLTKGTRKVKICGSYVFNVSLTPPHKHKATTRGSLPADAVFKTKGGTNLYANLGRNRDKEMVSENLISRDYAVGTNENGAIIQIGTFSVSTSTLV